MTRITVTANSDLESLEGFEALETVREARDPHGRLPCVPLLLAARLIEALGLRWWGLLLA